jgi:hypothetical protein
MTRQKLITHYQLASLVENKKPKNDIMRKRLASQVLAEFEELTDLQKASVLTCHELNLVNYGNAIRRASHRYTTKRY